MLDITAALTDPELGSVSFTVERIQCRRSRSGPIQKTQTYTASGCIHPATPETLQLLPQEHRHEEAIVIYTSFSLTSGENFGAHYTLPDRIIYRGQAYRIVRVRTWKEFSYCQAMAVLLQEEIQDDT